MALLGRAVENLLCYLFLTSIEARSVAGEAGETAMEGTQYDQILQIDISDDAEPLPLGWNRGGELSMYDETKPFIALITCTGDPRAAAKDFISRHSLPTSYEDQLIAFIEQVGVK